MRKTTKEWIEDAKQTHGDKFDYSESVYTRWDAKVKIYCHDCNDFFYSPARNHVKGSGCNICSSRKNARTKQISVDEFISRANEVHSGFYDYSKVSFESYTRDKVTVICPKHGEFKVLPFSHLKHGCKSCHNESSFLNNDEYIRRANEVHNNEYTYELSDYKGMHYDITIICPTHGPFRMRADGHLYRAHKCQKCVNARTRSLPEIELCDYISRLIDVDYSNRDVLNGKELDIFIPDKNIAIEYNGVYWHSKHDMSYHVAKTEECENKNIELFHIHDTDNMTAVYHLIDSWFCDKLTHEFEVKPISKYTYDVFMNEYHIEGINEDELYYGLYSDELLACASVKVDRSVTVSRFAHKPCVDSKVAVNALVRALKSQFDCIVEVVANRRYENLKYDGEYSIKSPTLDSTKEGDIWNCGYKVYSIHH